MLVQTKDIGLSAYLRIKGERLVKCENRIMHFETDRPLEEWRVEYFESEAYRHDSEVMALKRLVSGE